ncbi:MAG: hypothetical protein CL785_01760 [Chloroflexi bacterium]|nr:hypothetical protein [Chloroflexota bacterium]|tara:strand:- start:9486 stop:10427 length:942 start_codon:yes stop_codon:yes gene_type:complete
MLSFWEVAEKLKNGFKEIHSLSLSDLSHLDTEQVNEVSGIWKKLSHKTKDNLLSELILMNDSSIHFDFNSIFLIAINDDDEDISCIAISGLWEYEHRDLINILIDKIHYHHSNKVKIASIFALGRFATLAEENKLSTHDFKIIKDILLQTISNDAIPYDTKKEAFEAISVFSIPEVDDLIRNMYYQDNTYLKKSAIFAMGRNGKLDWIPILLDELDSENYEIQCESIRACQEIGEEKFIPYLIPLLDSDEIEVILTVIIALGNIGGDLAKTSLQNLKHTINADSDDGDILIQAIIASLEIIEISQFTPNRDEI